MAFLPELSHANNSSPEEQARKLLAAASLTATSPEIKRLALSETWLRLVHAERKLSSDSASAFSVEVVTPGFYLSDAIAFDPERELLATIALLHSDAVSPEQESPLCRFPARYLWLSQMLGNAGESMSFDHCEQLAAWADLENVESLNLVQVSGYFGNPASAFGHLLLRVNKRGQSGARGLLDTGFNFGAVIPEGESTLRYIFKGIAGGYVAGFSEASFYAQDHVYSATENRDMWAHKLNLSRYQIELMLYHLWELKEVKFDYYFLRNNCAFHMAQLLELGLDQSFELEHRPWYPPIEVFHKLAAIDQKNEQTGESLIDDINFIPSHQRELYSAFNSLSRAEKKQVRQYVANPDSEIEQTTDRAQVLDFLLQYIDYKSPPVPHTAEEAGTPAEDHAQPDSDSEPDPELVRLAADRQAILARRMGFPAGKDATASLEPYTGEQWAPPLAGPRPGKVGIGLLTSDNSDSAGVIEVAPYSYDSLQRNKGSLTDSALEMLGATFAFRSDELVLQRLNLLRIEKLTANTTNLKGERRPAWRVAFGIEQPADKCESCLRGFARGGVGLSHTITKRGLMFGFANIGLNHAGLEAGVSAGVLFRPTGSLSIRLQTDGILANDGTSTLDTPSWTHSIGGLWSISKDIDMVLQGHLNDEQENLRIGAVLRF